MKKIAAAATTLGLAASGAMAGQIEREGDTSDILFEDGKNYLEATVSNVTPSISGTVGGGAIGSGNIQERFTQFSLGFKHELNDKWTLAFVGNSPVGADVRYTPGTPHPFSGGSAEVESNALTGYLKYQATDRVSVYGGVRVQALSGSVALPPLFAGYTLSVDDDYQVGYVLGAAYEIPDIALRVAATYESAIDHSFRDNVGTPFEVTIPQAFTVDFQTGVAANTLVFGSARWREWTEFEIAPVDFGTTVGLPGAAIAFGTSDIWTFELGVGRKFNENWSGAFSIGYEEDQGDVVGNLQGFDGFISYGVAVKYETEAYEFTTGIRYVDFGDTFTTTIGGDFQDNDAIAVGMQLGIKF
ncbi:OmpP1/FadL family transporter [Roseovarius rhodophyticola]|uniref:Outer membrane protein transport protein n=1 Tax=Roseovarius rhodophyticola TaxID=3080827 RepID=A0ABZ2THP2_9RHOB|nr:outer membrane protein transport protein [Roseovarius sp. W115]MDV2928172.1 outer membrane protein transport protein [Roseovarius sp. W115]